MTRVGQPGWGQVTAFALAGSRPGRAVRVQWLDGSVTVLSSCAVKPYEPSLLDLITFACRYPWLVGEW